MCILPVRLKPPYINLYHKHQPLSVTSFVRGTLPHQLVPRQTNLLGRRKNGEDREKVAWVRTTKTATADSQQNKRLCLWVWSEPSLDKLEYIYSVLYEVDTPQVISYGPYIRSLNNSLESGNELLSTTTLNLFISKSKLSRRNDAVASLFLVSEVTVSCMTIILHNLSDLFLSSTLFSVTFRIMIKYGN